MIQKQSQIIRHRGQTYPESSDELGRLLSRHFRAYRNEDPMCDENLTSHLLHLDFLGCRHKYG